MGKFRWCGHLPAKKSCDASFCSRLLIWIFWGYYCCEIHGSETGIGGWPRVLPSRTLFSEFFSCFPSKISHPLIFFWLTKLLDKLLLPQNLPSSVAKSYQHPCQPLPFLSLHTFLILFLLSCLPCSFVVFLYNPIDPQHY